MRHFLIIIQKNLHLAIESIIIGILNLTSYLILLPSSYNRAILFWCNWLLIERDIRLELIYE